MLNSPSTRLMRKLRSGRIAPATRKFADTERKQGRARRCLQGRQFVERSRAASEISCGKRTASSLSAAFSQPCGRLRRLVPLDFAFPCHAANWSLDLLHLMAMNAPLFADTKNAWRMLRLDAVDMCFRSWRHGG